MATETNSGVSDGNEVKGSKSIRLLDSLKKYLFIMGTCLLIFAAARNSFHWQIHRVWVASGRFWQICWDYLYNKFGQDDELFFSFAAVWVMTMSVFWLSNAFFLVLDITGMPQCVKKYKVQEDVQLDMAKFWKAIRLVLFNQCVVGLPFGLCTAYAFRLRGNSIGGELPSFPLVMFEMMVFSLVLEFCFYYSHRLLHHPRVYQHIHKIHHEWTAPIGVMSLYCHPIEYLLSVIMPTALGPLLVGAHLATALLWFSIAVMSTTVAHCGYHLPLFPSPEAHDYHHLKFNQNFGVLGVLDRLHGTDIQFRNSRQYQRHFMLLSLVPMSYQYPSSPKKKPE